MEYFIPTNRLRFVERRKVMHHPNDMLRVLQQWWDCMECLPGEHGEWRDVPLEQESSEDTSAAP